MIRNLNISKIIAFFFIILINYIFIFFSIYIVSAFLLINKITPNIELIRDYQRNFYQFGGIREIWQSNDNCIEYDKELIYVPKRSSCNFNNIEFETTLSFDNYGRYSDHPINYNNNSINDIISSFQWIKFTKSVINGPHTASLRCKYFCYRESSMEKTTYTE